MTMTDRERERLTILAAGQAAMMKDGEHMKESLKGVRARVEDMHGYLKDITVSMNEIRRQNEGHEERLAQLQNIASELVSAVAEVRLACRRLRHILFGFIAILVAFGVIVEALGVEIAPKFFKWLWALVGL